jgi:predicted kinase
VKTHVVDAPVEVRRERVRARNAGDATIQVDDTTFTWAEGYFEPLGDDELQGAAIVAT